MGSQILRFVGRIFIVTLLLTSSVMKLGNPSSYESTVKNTYTKTKSMFPVLSFLPTTEKLAPHMNKIIAGLGAIQGIAALLILFGDRLGGIIFTIGIIISQISINGFAMIQVLKLVNVGKILEMGPFLCLLGIGLILSDTDYIRRKARNY